MTAGLRRLSCTALAFALAGCALSTPPAHEAVVKEALRETQIPPAWQADKRVGEVGDGWLRTFNDPALDRIVAEAIASNPDLRQAASRVEIALQQVVIAGAQLQPQVGAQLGANRIFDRDQGHANKTLAFVGVGWELDVWGRLRAQRAASEATAEAATLDYAYARQSLAATAARLWILATEAEQLVALSEQAVRVYGELLQLVQARRAAGKVSDLDVVDARANLATARAQLEMSRMTQGEVRRGLEVLLGRYPAAEIATQGDYPALPPPPGAGVPSAVLERRPDLMAAETAVLAAFRMEEAARLSLLPSFSISLGGGYLNDPLLKTLGLDSWLASAGIGMLVPIYEGGALRAQVAIATAQQAAAVANYGSVMLGAFKEIENALANEQLLARQRVFADAALQDRNEAVRIATAQYRAGRIDELWVANMQTQQLVANMAAIKVRSTERTNRIQLYLALGSRYDSPEPASEGAAYLRRFSPAAGALVTRPMNIPTALRAFPQQEGRDAS